MKKLWALLITSAMSISLQAQDNSDAEVGFLRFEASAGLYTSKDIYTDINYNTNDIWSRNTTATYFATFSFYRYKKAEVGMALGYQKPYIEDTYTFTPNGRELTSVYVDYLTILPQIRLNWISSVDKKFELYSTFGMGLTRVMEDDRSSADNDGAFFIPAFHVNGLGMRFGNKFGGFMEIGFGTKGIMSAGVSYRL